VGFRIYDKRQGPTEEKEVPSGLKREKETWGVEKRILERDWLGKDPREETTAFEGKRQTVVVMQR